MPQLPLLDRERLWALRYQNRTAPNADLIRRRAELQASDDVVLRAALIIGMLLVVKPPAATGFLGSQYCAVPLSFRGQVMSRRQVFLARGYDGLDGSMVERNGLYLYVQARGLDKDFLDQIQHWLSPVYDLIERTDWCLVFRIE